MERMKKNSRVNWTLKKLEKKKTKKTIENKKEKKLID